MAHHDPPQSFHHALENLIDASSPAPLGLLDANTVASGAS